MMKILVAIKTTQIFIARFMKAWSIQIPVFIPVQEMNKKLYRLDQTRKYRRVFENIKDFLDTIFAKNHQNCPKALLRLPVGAFLAQKPCN